MKHAYSKCRPTLGTFILSGLLLAGLGVISSAHADDHDQQWRDHQRQERTWQAHEHGHAQWDHHYWDRDRGVYVYRPPAVYYAPAPPVGLDFVFRVGR